MTPQLSTTISILASPVAADTITCIYPISGQYGLLPRIFFYITLFLCIFARNEWLVAACLLSVMTYTGTGAIHAFVLAKQNHAVLDLDARVLLPLLAAALLCFSPILQWSGTLRSQSGRRIFELWVALVLVGALCCIGGFLGPRTETETECRSVDGALRRSPRDSGFNCTYTCFSSAGSPVRGREDVIAVGTQTVNSEPQIKMLVFTIVLALVCIVCLPLYAIATRELETTQRDREEARLKASLGAKEGARRESVLPKVFATFCVGALVAVVAVNERFVIRGLVSTEEPYAVGQWAGFVAAALVVTATAVNWWIERSSGLKVTTRVVRTT
ncbi:hypothetical protein K440DRAFT_610574 [Wilcoxina mikolae CBS 423.85]|nr:hypothetical protein K440DRAFT_610574 [Wilcoxina mikolae CBS 423.85]